MGHDRGTKCVSSEEYTQRFIALCTIYRLVRWKLLDPDIRASNLTLIRH